MHVQLMYCNLTQIDSNRSFVVEHFTLVAEIRLFYYLSSVATNNCSITIYLHNQDVAANNSVVGSYC